MAQKRSRDDGMMTVRVGAGGSLEIESQASESGHMLELGGMSAVSQQRADAVMRQLEAKRRARTIPLPTNDFDVRRLLRQLAEPITLFGEGPPDRRERLRGVMARLAVEAEAGARTDQVTRYREIQRGDGDAGNGLPIAEPRTIKRSYDTRGTAELLAARAHILRFSIPRARVRLRTAKRRRAALAAESVRTDALRQYASHATRLRGFANATSEVGGSRPLSSCALSPDATRLATASWSGMCKVWSVPESSIQCTLRGHEDRVTDIACNPQRGLGADVVTAGVDGTLRVWNLADATQAPMNVVNSGMGKAEASAADAAASASIVRPSATLRGHQDRLSRACFHPSGRYAASSSYDLTWRLWDLESEKEVLRQEGHSSPVYGLAFQCDGALVASGDLGGVCHAWDLRTGRPIMQFKGHVDGILSVDFAPNGYQAASSGLDNTVRIWDLRKRGISYSILAHKKLVSDVRYEPSQGDFLFSSSYDQTVKVWSARDYQLIKTLFGHEGRVTRVAVSKESGVIATTSFDRTWKLWLHENDM